MNAEFKSLTVNAQVSALDGEVSLFCTASALSTKLFGRRTRKKQRPVSKVFVWTSCRLDLDLIQTMWLKAHD